MPELTDPAYETLTSAASDDLLMVVDVNDETMSANGTTKKITVGGLGLASYPDQQPALDSGLSGGTGGPGGGFPDTGNADMLGLAAAIANRNNARVDIPVIGESITEGYGATQFTTRWIAQANRAIRNLYPTTANGSGGGLGFIPIQYTTAETYTWPVTLATGSATNLDLGPVRYCSYQLGASSYTWTAPAGTTSVKIMYYDVPLSGSFTYKVGSGSTTTVTGTQTAVDILTASITITSGEVLTIAWASGACCIDGIMHFAGDENSGITFHGCGHAGWDSGAGVPYGWNQPETFSVNWAQVYANGFPTTPAAIMIMLGAGDALVSVGDYTASQFQSNMLALIALIRAQASLASVPLLLGLEYEVNEPLVQAWPLYAAALREVQAATPSSQIIDLNYRMPSIASDWDGSALYHDTRHPYDLGHALIGEIVAAGTRIA